MVNFLSQNEGIMVHGAAIKYKGAGTVFLGPTESGKSTLSRLWKEDGDAIALSDETIVIRKHNQRFFVYGTPRGGSEKIMEPVRAPLKDIFFIKHGSNNQIKSISKSLALQKLLPQIFLPFWSKERMDNILRLSQDLIDSFGGKEFTFVKDRSAVEFIKNFFREIKK